MYTLKSIGHMQKRSNSDYEHWNSSSNDCLVAKPHDVAFQNLGVSKKIFWKKIHLLTIVKKFVIYSHIFPVRKGLCTESIGGLWQFLNYVGIVTLQIWFRFGFGHWLRHFLNGIESKIQNVLFKPVGMERIHAASLGHTKKIIAAEFWDRRMFSEY